MGSGAIAQIVSAIQNDQIYNFRDQQESAKIPSSALRHFLRVLSARPVAAAIWPKRWGNDQAAGRRQTRRRGGVTTRGVPRGCVGGQVGARGAGEGVFIITKKTYLGRGEKWNHFVRVFPYLRNFLSSFI